MRELNHGEDGSYGGPTEGAGAYRGPITAENGSAEPPNKGFCHQRARGVQKVAGGDTCEWTASSVTSYRSNDVLPPPSPKALRMESSERE